MLTKLLPLFLLLQACAPTLPMVKKDTVTLPRAYPAGANNSSGPSADISWKEFFNDPALVGMIETALKGNQELRMLEQEIHVANNEVMARQGEYLPKVSATAGGGVEKAERFDAKGASEPLQFGRAGFVATWEVDIWKRLRNATKAAYFGYLGSIEGRRLATTHLVAEVANTYYELMALDNQLTTVQSYIDVLEKIRKFVSLQQLAGRVTSLPVKRFEAEVLKNQGRQYEILQRITVTQNQLNVLLGRFPQRINRDSKAFLELSLPRVGTSVPVKLLDNRPDVRKAGFELEAAKVSVDAARARFYPSLSIDAEAGYESFNSSHLVDPVHGTFYGVSAGLMAPFLNRKAIKADYFSANNRQISAVYDYELSLVRAFSEVVNQLNMIRNFDSVVEAKTKQVRALNDAIEISNTLFKAARVDYVESLLTQRDALEAQVELIETKRLQLSAYVDLYKALGGGWKGTEEHFQSYY